METFLQSNPSITAFKISSVACSGLNLALLLLAVPRRNSLLCCLYCFSMEFLEFSPVWGWFAPPGPQILDDFYGLESPGQVGADVASTFCFGFEFKLTE